MNVQIPPGYRAVLEGASYYRVPNPGYLAINGRDQIDFLQRQTTNDLRQLLPNQVRTTVLTTPAARILDVLQIFSTQTGLACLTLPGNSTHTAEYLRSRIFFMDQVNVDDWSRDYAQFELNGPRVSQILGQSGLVEIPSIGQFATLASGEQKVQVIGQNGFGGPGFLLLIPAGVVHALVKQLEQAGAIALPEDTYQILRVEAGRPQAAAELSEAYTPLEVNLRDMIADAKGCYTGQEVITRQITYDKVTQSLVGLRCATPLEAGMRLWAQDKPVGQVTSAAISPRLGPLALGMVKRPHFEPDNKLQARLDGVTETLEVDVVALPFDKDKA